jgi:hypothetical protein
VTLEPFPGYPTFLEAAAQELGLPAAADPARRVSTVSALANLCAQAAIAEVGAVAGILAKAEEFCDQLRVAARAGELMLASIRASRGLPAAGPVELDVAEPRSNAPRRAKGRSIS